LPALRFAHTAQEVRVRDLFDFLLRGLAWGTALGDDAPEPRRCPAETGYTNSEPGRAYGEKCQLLSFACVQLTELDRVRLPAGSFPTSEERLLFEYGACIRLGDSVHNPVWTPSTRQAERYCRDNALSLWRCWRALALKESLVFLATEDLGFTRRNLPNIVEADYLPLYLYTLYQRFQLSIFANDLMREVAQVEGHLRGARSLLRRFTAFRNRFWFSEVTRRPQGGDLYRALQQGLELPALYQMVTTSVKDAKEYYEERWDRQVRLVVTILGLTFGPLAAAAGPALYLWKVLGPAATVLSLAAMVVGIGALLLVLMSRGIRRRRPRRRRRRVVSNAEAYRLDSPPRDAKQEKAA
jgi:hypothetical protein